jgi:hypothetical protein
MDEHGHGRLGDEGEIFGDVLLTGVEREATWEGTNDINPRYR